jgi:hypothetical protein
MPDKKYYVDAYFYFCPTCQGQVLGKKYYALFELAEMAAAKRVGLITYTCSYLYCRASYPSDRLPTNDDVVEVSKEEALKNGLDFESKRSA